MINSMMGRELVEQRMNDELEMAIERSWSKAAVTGSRTVRFGQLRRDAGRFLIGVGIRIQGRAIDADQIVPATH